jgi:hypothetical protein
MDFEAICVVTNPIEYLEAEKPQENQGDGLTVLNLTGAPEVENLEVSFSQN